MTVDTADIEQKAQSPSEGTSEEPSPSAPRFILYLEGPEYATNLRQLTLWTHHVLLPVYGREVTSAAPWCSRWWEHQEAVAQLHGPVARLGGFDRPRLLDVRARQLAPRLPGAGHAVTARSVGSLRRLQTRQPPVEGEAPRRCRRPVRP